MFPHLCRACLKELDSSDCVPLFESHKNIWYHRLISTTFRWSLSKDDNLASNICKSCAVEVLKSFKFRLQYIESNRKLQQMLNGSKKEPANDRDTITTSDTPAPLRWKCNLCSTRFISRSLYREHRRLSHPKPNPNKCIHCPAEFPTKKIRLIHEEEHRLDKARLNEPIVIIKEDDSDNVVSITPNITEVNVNIDQKTFKFIDQKPGMDRALYFVEKPSQLHSVDPLEVDDFSYDDGEELLIPSVTVEYGDVMNIYKWECRICDEMFRTRDLLREHKRSHSSSKSSISKQVTKINRVKIIQKAKEMNDGQAKLENLHRNSNAKHASQHSKREND